MRRGSARGRCCPPERSRRDVLRRTFASSARSLSGRSVNAASGMRCGVAFSRAAIGYRAHGGFRHRPLVRCVQPDMARLVAEVPGVVRLLSGHAGLSGASAVARVVRHDALLNRPRRRRRRSRRHGTRRARRAGQIRRAEGRSPGRCGRTAWRARSRLPVSSGESRPTTPSSASRRARSIRRPASSPASVSRSPRVRPSGPGPRSSSPESTRRPTTRTQPECVMASVAARSDTGLAGPCPHGEHRGDGRGVEPGFPPGATGPAGPRGRRPARPASSPSVPSSMPSKKCDTDTCLPHTCAHGRGRGQGWGRGDGRRGTATPRRGWTGPGVA